jgi:putative ABC transport system ATP-binding protein
MLQEILVQGKRSLVLVTHDAGVAGHADRIVHLLDGRIQRIETPPRAPGKLIYELEETA